MNCRPMRIKKAHNDIDKMDFLRKSTHFPEDPIPFFFVNHLIIDFFQGIVHASGLIL
jgi:hypothetical protein